MPVQVLMPALSPTMEKGNLAKWFKKEGDAVRPGDIIADAAEFAQASPEPDPSELWTDVLAEV